MGLLSCCVYVQTNELVRFMYTLDWNIRLYRMVRVSKPLFQTVSNAVRMHHLSSLFSKFPVKFHIVSDAVRMHHSASLFSKLCLQFQSFQMPSEWTLHRPCFQNYLRNSKLFQIPSENTIYCPCFQFFQEATLVLMLPSCVGTKYVKKILIEVSTIVQKSVKRQALATLFWKLSNQFQILPN